jgi:cytochrome c553
MKRNLPTSKLQSCKLLVAAAMSVPALALFPMSPVFAAEGAAKPDLTHAKQIVDTICAACHGADGNSVAAANPNLAGQGAEYITRQLQHFKSGVRANAIMAPMSATLTADDMVALGIYFSQQKPKGGVARDPALVKSGQSLFRGGVATAGLPACASCHSPTGAGIPKNYPRLAGQHAEYSYAQLKAFMAGERGADKEGKDTQGKIMATIAAKMTDEQMKAVADYTAGLR